jgi:hypothetical protein
MSEAKTPTAAPVAGDTPAAPDAALLMMQAPQQAWLQQSLAWLQAVQALQRAQMGITGMALKQLEASQQRLAQCSSCADALAIPVKLAQFGGAASLRLAQELSDIGLRAATEANGTMIDAALRAMPALPRIDPLLPLSLFHLGIHPMDDLFGAALNRYLMPNTAA